MVRDKTRWDEVFDGIEKIGEYSDDWDGQGAPAIPQGAIAGAKTLANFLTQKGVEPPLVVPSVNESVFFEWSDARHYAEVEIVGENTAELRFFAKD